jgi:hypothetical protein
MAPAAFSTAYSKGAACPFEKMRRSLPGSRGLPRSVRQCEARNTAIRSAADIDDVGCPDPAAVVERMLSARSCVASSFQTPGSPMANS